MQKKVESFVFFHWSTKAHQSLPEPTSSGFKWGHFSGKMFPFKSGTGGLWLALVGSIRIDF